MYRAHLLLFAVAVIGVAFGPPPSRRIAERIVDPKLQKITLHWKDAQGQAFGNIGALEKWCTGQGRELYFAMNGGMYHPDHSPVGLYVEDGQQLKRLDTAATGSGNFRMQPNGVFGLRKDGSAFVCTTARYPQQREVHYATQSGPMLVVDGQVNQLFTAGSKNLNIRNGVGVRPDGRVVFGISREPINFHDFASWFIERGCTDALYLDGAVSRAWIPEEGLRQADGDLGVLIAVMAGR